MVEPYGVGVDTAMPLRSFDVTHLFLFLTCQCHYSSLKPSAARMRRT